MLAPLRALPTPFYVGSFNGESVTRPTFIFVRQTAPRLAHDAVRFHAIWAVRTNITKSSSASIDAT